MSPAARKVQLLVDKWWEIWKDMRYSPGYRTEPPEMAEWTKTIEAECKARGIDGSIFPIAYSCMRVKSKITEKAFYELLEALDALREKLFKE